MLVEASIGLLVAMLFIYIAVIRSTGSRELEDRLSIYLSISALFTLIGITNPLGFTCAAASLVVGIAVEYLRSRKRMR